VVVEVGNFAAAGVWVLNLSKIVDIACAPTILETNLVSLAIACGPCCV